MNLGLEDTVAFVAGSSRGIGRAVALAFLQEGASVAVTGRDAIHVDDAVADLGGVAGLDRVVGQVGDLGDAGHAAEALAHTRERFGRLDAVVLNIGSGSGVGGYAPGPEEWGRLFEANLWASVRLAEAALPDLVAGGNGSITFVASIAGLEDVRAPLPYASAKAALVQYSKGLAFQVGRDGVRVNCVAPGNVLFPGGSWSDKVTAEPARWEAYVRQEVALGRFASPEEIADAVVFLASPRASFVTGACLVVDGGQTRSV